MFGLTSETKVFIRTGPTDGRLGMPALRALTANVMNQDVKAGYLFCFANRARNRLRMLWADESGFFLATKVLDEGTFDFPRDGGPPKVVSFAKLEALVRGTRFTAVTKEAPLSNGGYRR